VAFGHWRFESFNRHMNTKAQGDVGVALAIAYYTLLGHKVVVPLSDDLRYDLVVDKSGTLVRVQCKTTRHQKPNGTYVVQVATSGGNQSWNKVAKTLSRTETDELFVYSFDGKCYVFGPEVFDGKKNITLSSDKEEYIMWATATPLEV
jgi:hypothetical protein